MSESKETTAIAITNDYPSDKYNLLIPVKTIQELSSMYRIVMNQVEINPDYNHGNDVYVQTKGYGDIPDKLALTKTALSKLMTAAGIEMIYSKPIIPSTHLSAIEMAKAIGKAVPYDTRDIAHEVAIAVPDASGQRRTITATKEIIIEDLKAEYAEQKKNLEIWEKKNGKSTKRAATEEEKEAAVEKQLTQFSAHKRAQIETKTLNRALREAMMIKSTYTAEELQKPFVVAQIVPNLDQPELKQIMLNKYADGVASLFGVTDKSNTKVLQQPTNEDVPLIESGEIITPDEQHEDNGKNDNSNIQDADYTEDKLLCEECNSEIKGNEKASAAEIAEYTNETFKKTLCAECFKEENEKLKQKMGGK